MPGAGHLGNVHERAVSMVEITCEMVAEKFENYPDRIKERLLFLRQLIFEVASENDVSEIRETLKWGEPSYIAKSGSTVRIDWKKANPTQYAMYFTCNTLLVETFRELYGDRFRFDGNRAIVFDENEEISVSALKHCIVLALNYHRVKHLPMLGA